MSDNPWMREDNEAAETIYDQERYNSLISRKGFLEHRLKKLKVIPNNAAHPDPEVRDGWIARIEQELREVEVLLVKVGERL